jgi:alanine-glyoxylate transaminase/serine-glyoxylate transaminase/serine-pyruvate transaminase
MNDKNKITYSKERILLGPGPSCVNPRVLQAMARPMIGHLDPIFLDIMEEVQEHLRYVFQTENKFTIAISGTGSAGMETCLCNLIEEGDDVLVGVNGVFGERMSDIVNRCRAKLHRLEADWGDVISPETIETAMKETGAKIVALVHAETSTGALQPLEQIGTITREHDALLLVDAVTSLGGIPLEMDKRNIDICYSGTQKCLSIPPGLSPISLNQRALDRIHKRKSSVPSWYLDLTMISKYWDSERAYHHTAPISMIFALDEGLKIIKEEGLEKRFHRHKRNHLALVAGLEALGLQMVVKKEHRIWSLNSVWVPDGISELNVRKKLLERYNIEVGAGLGDFKGKVWRIGLMGHSSSENNVLLLLAALEDILTEEGYNLQGKNGVLAAINYYQQNN